MAATNKKRKLKFFLSFLKEREWLESIAGQGWFLDNITYGILYTFRQGAPRHMLYEIDRFNLPKKPTMEDIRRKELFMDMAGELGWREVTHDESLTYYFCKEYADGDINEICNDEASREQRAEKFGWYFEKRARELIFWTFVITVLAILVGMEMKALRETYLDWFQWFALAYGALCCGISLVCWKAGDLCRRELMMTRKEWEEQKDKEKYRTVRRLVWTGKGLNRFLKNEASRGWVLKSVQLTLYRFEKRGGEEQVYTLDSKWMTNKRRRQRREERLRDRKDWVGMNNDWQIQSVKDAEEKGWTFVCALENRAIIYRGDAARVEPLNSPKYDNSLRGISLIGEYGLKLCVAGLVGGIVGFLAALFRVL